MTTPLEELVAHLAGACALQLAPATAQRARRGRFDVDACSIGEPRLEPLEHCRQRILPERRIEENHAETLPGTAEIRSRIAKHQLDIARADRLARDLQRVERGAICFHHHDARGAARGRLEAERTGAGEKIEATLAAEPLSQPVEERLAHAIRRRAQSRARGDADAPAAILARDDADLPFARMH